MLTNKNYINIMNTQNILNHLSTLRCPSCKNSLTLLNNKMLECDNCKQTYPVYKDFTSLIDRKSYSKDQEKMSEWWDDLCQQWYSELDKTLTSENLYSLFDKLKKSYRDENHLIFNANLKNLKGKKLLDIGCGGGIHDSLFKKYGAHVTAIDISAKRAYSAGLKMNLVKEGSGLAVQANGENLPFKDNVFNIVYSNGVMHH